MKNTIILCFLVSFCARCLAQQTTNSFSIFLNDQPLNELVRQLESKSNYHFFYDDAAFDSISFSVNLQNTTMGTVLDTLFNPPFYYAVYGRNIFLTKGKKIYTSLPAKQNSESMPSLPPQARLAADLSSESKPPAASLETKIYTIGTGNSPGKSNATLAGYVKNSETGEFVPGVAILTSTPGLGSVTDGYGFYSLVLPKGRHNLRIKGIGLKETRRQIILKSDGKLDINVQDEPFSLKEVVVSAEQAANVRRSTMGLEKLDIKTIKQVPTVFGEADIFKVVLTLPGVKSVGESSSGFNVRGGSVDQNLILFNDATIFNPSHFFGFFSAVNPEMVKDIQLYKSSIPAKYGGRLSSVLELNSRDGNSKEFTASAGLGLITSRLNIEGPLIKDRTTFIMGGRTTYSNWIMGLLPKSAGYQNAKASFYDVNLNITHKQNEKNSFYATAYLSSDESNLATDTTFKYRNQSAAVRWKHMFSNKLYGVFSGGYDQYSYINHSNYQEDVDYRLKFSVGQAYFKSNFSYHPAHKWSIDFGGSSIRYQNKPGSLEPLNEKSLVIKAKLPAEQALESAVFLEHRYDLTEKITLNGGLRYSLYTALGPLNVKRYASDLPKNDANVVAVESFERGQSVKTYHAPEYRLGARYSVSQDFSIKASFNTQRQYIHMLSNTTAISPTDVWKLSDMNITPQRGSQVSLGLYKNFKSNTIETSVEGYYKRIDDFLDYKSGAVLILNHSIEQDVLPTQGKAYGLEFMIKKLAGKVNGWMSYTYSRTMLKTPDVSGANSINDGKFYPANYDKPHDFTFIGNYRFSHRISFSTNFTYSTGRPITLPVGKYYYSGGQRLLYSDRNQYRIPDYLRSDISFNFLGNHNKRQFTHSSWTVGVYNVTGRKNVFSSFFASENKIINGYSLSIFGSAIPFINYNIQFK